MILFFLVSGIFLGWSLGANDLSNVFGSAIGARMISFRKAAMIACVFVILGAVLQGTGTSGTLAKLGSVNAIGGSFTVALAAAITVYMMTRFGVPVSSTQAIVGAIIGWNLFTGNRTNTGVLFQIVSGWITGPVLGAVFAVILYILLMKFKRRAKIHLLRFESYIKTALIIIGAFGAYSIGANNIANVMGVFIPSFHLQDLDLRIIILNSDQQLFLIGSIAMAAGILTYSKKVVSTIGENIFALSSEAALIVVLAQSMVLFLFSSTFLANLATGLGIPSLPLVPVSSSQLVIGCIVGIGLYKGAHNLNYKMLGEVAIGWVTTPVASALLSFFLLFFIRNIFNLDVGTGTQPAAVHSAGNMPAGDISEIIRYFLLGVLISGAIAIIYFLILERQKKIALRRSEERFWKNIK